MLAQKYIFNKIDGGGEMETEVEGMARWRCVSVYKLSTAWTHSNSHVERNLPWGRKHQSRFNKIRLEFPSVSGKSRESFNDLLMIVILG